MELKFKFNKIGKLKGEQIMYLKSEWRMMNDAEYRMRFTAAAYKHYGLEGKDVEVKWRTAPFKELAKWLPVKIVKEYPKFLYGIVKKHGDASAEYPITLNKIGILFDDYKIKVKGNII